MKTLTSLFTLGAVLLLSRFRRLRGAVVGGKVLQGGRQEALRRREARRQITACVNEHFKDLSADCQVAIIRVVAVGKACQADVKSFCADVKRKAAVPACLKAHAADLSDGCKAGHGESQCRRQVGMTSIRN